MCKINCILKGISNHQLKIPSKKERFGYGTGWDESTMAWAERNDMEVSSRITAKKSGSWKDEFVGGDEGGGGKYLVVNRLKGRILKIG